MPITGVYEWIDKNNVVIISIPLKGVSLNKVDIVATKYTLKVNFAPYLIDLVLFDEIDPNQHKARVKNGILNITLNKLRVIKWNSLINTSSEANTIKEQSIKDYELDLKEIEEKRKDRKVTDERYSTRSQMNLDEKERNRLDNLKLEEKIKAEAEVYKTFADLEATKWNNKDNINVNKDSIKVNNNSIKTDSNNNNNNNNNKIFNDEEISDTDIINDILENKSENECNIRENKELKNINNDEIINSNIIFNNINNNSDELNDDVVYLLPPREKQKIELSFTPRIFPTPMRESAKAQEEDWIAKNRKHLKKHGVYAANHNAMLTRNKNGNISEEDPIWLKAKGDEYIRHKDYLSAINVYSTAIDLDETMVSCYANRSICYLSQQMYPDCIDDCDCGIRLLINKNITKNSDGEELSNLNAHSLSEYQMLVKLYMRKATARCQLGSYNEALHAIDLGMTFHKEISDYINKLNNNDINLLNNIKSISDSLENDMNKIKLLRDAELLKLEGDKYAEKKQFDEAIITYTKALGLIPVYISCLSNRSACKLAKEDLKGCISDCSNAITLLQYNIKSKDNNNNNNINKSDLIVLGTTLNNNCMNNLTMLEAILPPENSEKRKKWLLTTVVRRGVANFELGLLDDAVNDYGYASSLDPKDAKLKNDLTRIINTRAARNIK